MRRLVCEVRPAGKPGAPPFPYLPVVARASSTRCLAAPREQAFESHHESHAFSDSEKILLPRQQINRGLLSCQLGDFPVSWDAFTWVAQILRAPLSAYSQLRGARRELFQLRPLL